MDLKNRPATSLNSLKLVGTFKVACHLPDIVPSLNAISTHSVTLTALR